jgi:predicted transcriptional regulator
MSDVHMKTIITLDRYTVADYIKAADKELFVYHLVDTHENDYNKYAEVREHVNAVRGSLIEQAESLYGYTEEV